MATLRSFVHGNAFVAEKVGESSGPLAVIHDSIDESVPLSDVVGMPQGWGRTYRGKTGQANWFHVAIPTHSFAFISEQKLELKKIFLLFDAMDDCYIDQVHVWDGGELMFVIAFVKITGDHRRIFEPDINSFELDRYRYKTEGTKDVKTGVGISVHVNFPREANIVFYSAGA